MYTVYIYIYTNTYTEPNKILKWIPVLGCWPTEKLVKIMISAAADTASPWLSLRHSRRGHRTPKKRTF